MMRLVRRLLIAVMAASSGVAIGGERLIVAVDPTYPPMESEDDKGELAGFDIDLARELGTRLGRKTEFMVMSYEGILSGLQTTRYDLIISAMNITAERLKQVDFVEYGRMAQLFVAKPGVTIKGEKDLAGKVVAVATDTTSFEYLNGLAGRGVKLGDLKGFRLMSDVFVAVKTGHAVALVCDEPVARHYVKADPKSFAIAGRAMAPEPLGIAVRKGNKQLYDAVAAAVEAMKKDGTMLQLQVRWFGAALGS
jgi:polar amino acid transport system substrate-binding protein